MRQRERLILPGIELAGAGLAISFSRGRVKASVSRTQRAAAWAFGSSCSRLVRTATDRGLAAAAVAGNADRRWRRLCRNRHTRCHDPRKLSAGTHHCRKSFMSIDSIGPGVALTPCGGIQGRFFQLFRKQTPSCVREPPAYRAWRSSTAAGASLSRGEWPRYSSAISRLPRASSVA